MTLTLSRKEVLVNTPVTLSTRRIYFSSGWLMVLLVSSLSAYVGITYASETRPSAHAGIPTFSAPIAFVARDEGGFEKWVEHIFVMNPDGSAQIRLTREVRGWDAAWSPDGDRLAFTCPIDGNLEICVMNADGSRLSRLTKNGARDENPTWSPDGTRIAFASNREGPFQIYLMNADGREEMALTLTAANEMEPAWSPDGKHIAFTSDRVNKDKFLLDREIFLMNPDGTGQTGLSNHGSACTDESPAWSPDSTQIAFASDCAGQWSQVYSMNADGSGAKRLTNDPAQDRHPAWSPDGRQIVFDSNRDLADAGIRILREDSQVYRMNADGSAQTRLTSNLVAFSSGPAWRWSQMGPTR